MTIDDNTIDKLAKLSSLEIDESKRESLKNELGDIINFVENLNEIDVSHIDATFSTVEGGTPLREDIANQDLDALYNWTTTLENKLSEKQNVIAKEVLKAEKFQTLKGAIA